MTLTFGFGLNLEFGLGQTEADFSIRDFSFLLKKAKFQPYLIIQPNYFDSFDYYLDIFFSSSAPVPAKLG